MTDQEKIEAAQQRYLAAAHAMQSGVAGETAFHQSKGERDTATEPKHLRVGVNTAKVDHGALVALLVSKGIITNLEYFETLADHMEAEQSRYEAHLSGLMGKPVTLA